MKTLCALLLLCAPQPIQDQITKAPASSHTTLVFFRANDKAGLNKPAIYLDGKQIARLQRGRYFSIQIPPGKYMIDFDHHPLPPVAISTNNGELFFEVRLDWGLKGSWRYVETAREKALEKIQGLLPLNSRDVRDSRVKLEPIGEQANKTAP